MSCEITILTPTFNRERELPKLYESLKKQTSREFCWLLVDDGSTDHTEQLAREWEREAAVSLEYVKKENGGKHTALNLGIGRIHTALTFIVDSDDWLPEDAVEAVLAYHQKYRETAGLCGYSFLRFYPDGRVNEAYFPENEKIDTYVNVRINGSIAGDKAEVFLTDVLKQYPFPVYGNEKFLPEDLVWVKMSGPYKMVHINKCIYISEYLENGLTKSGRRMKLKSPVGMMARSAVYLEDKAVNWKTKIKMAMLYRIYQSEAGRRVEVNSTSGRLLLFAAWFPGKLFWLLWQRKYKQ